MAIKIQGNKGCGVSSNGIVTAAVANVPGLSWRVIARVSDHLVKIEFR